MDTHALNASSLEGEDKVARLHTALCEFGLIKGELSPPNILNSYISNGFTEGGEGAEFVALVCRLCRELSVLYGLERASGGGMEVDYASQTEAYLTELSALLSELGCTDVSMTSGPLGERFASKGSRIQLLHFLLGHIKAARVCAQKRIQSEKGVKAAKKKNEREALFSILSSVSSAAEVVGAGCLEGGKFMDALKQAIDRSTSIATTASSASSSMSHKPLFTEELSPEEWQVVEEYAKKLNNEFEQRTELMLKRLDVTVESFFWSDRVKKLEPEVMAVYKPCRQQLSYGGHIGKEELLAATDELLIVDKASSGRVRQSTRSAISGYTLKEQPKDRGGRTTEMNEPSGRGGWGGGGGQRGGGQRGGGQRGGRGGGQRGGRGGGRR